MRHTRSTGTGECGPGAATAVSVLAVAGACAGGRVGGRDEAYRSTGTGVSGPGEQQQPPNGLALALVLGVPRLAKRSQCRCG